MHVFIFDCLAKFYKSMLCIKKEHRSVLRSLNYLVDPWKVAGVKIESERFYRRTEFPYSIRFWCQPVGLGSTVGWLTWNIRDYLFTAWFILKEYFSAKKNVFVLSLHLLSARHQFHNNNNNRCCRCFWVCWNALNFLSRLGHRPIHGDVLLWFLIWFSKRATTTTKLLTVSQPTRFQPRWDAAPSSLSSNDI